jgi:MFS family permease
VRAEGGYGAVLAERPVRRLLLASLAGRLSFSMLPLAFVLFAAGETGSAADAGAVVAAFSVASALAPARGRLVDRRGPPALIAFALGCSAGIAAVAAAGAAGAPTAVLVALGGLTGAAVPPLGPFTRAVWGGQRPDRLQRVFALDSAGEEAADIVAPLLVALIVAVASAGAALLVAAAGLLGGTVAAARSGLSAALVRTEQAARVRLPRSLWLVIAALIAPGAAIGAITVAVPALARAADAPARAGLIIAAFALGTPVAGLLTGRRAWRWPPARRLAALDAALAGTLAAAAAAAERPLVLALALMTAGMALGALFVTVYLVAGELSPDGAATRTFAWLVTANNGGLALGAVVAGAVIGRHGGSGGIRVALLCALAGVPVALAAWLAGSHADVAGPSPEGAP